MSTTNWDIDVVHSGIHFAIRHMVVSKVRGSFTKFAGTIRLDEEEMARSNIDVIVDVGSIDTQVSGRDAHLRSPDFFDTETFPEMRFRSKRIEKLDEARMRVVGDLMIRGVTRETALDVEYGGRVRDPWGSERLGFLARTSIDRRDFGLVWNQALDAGAIVLGDRVDIEIDIEAVRAARLRAAA